MVILAVSFLMWLMMYPKELKEALLLKFRYPEDVICSLIGWLLLALLLVGSTYIVVAILYHN